MFSDRQHHHVKPSNRMDGYEQLDGDDDSVGTHHHQSLVAHGNSSGYHLAQLNHGQGQSRSLSISDSAIHLTSMAGKSPNVATQKKHNQSELKLGGSINLGSICLLHPTSSTFINKPHNEYAGGTEMEAHWHPNSTCSKFSRRQNILLICFGIFYAFYLVIGGLCFQSIETPVERMIRSSISDLRSKFLADHPNVTDDDLEEFLTAVITANDRGISPLRNASNEMNWSFGQALFFSSTVITTIGYGHVTPLSQTGKIFCIIYATVGIPLTLVLLSAVVERLLVPANWLLGSLNSKLGHLYQPFNIRLLHLTIIVLLVLVVFFAIPTTVFALIEPAWGVLDAFYYCFISLTTIGLGDYIPGEGVTADNRSLYKMLITGYLICGLIAMMLVLTIFYDIPQLNLGQLFTESVSGETEKLRLSSNNATCYSGPSGLYMPQRDEDGCRAVVRIRPHGDDSPSPDEAPSTLGHDMRMP